MTETMMTPAQKAWATRKARQAAGFTAPASVPVNVTRTNRQSLGRGTYEVVVQARDGKWHYGPSTREQEMRDSPRGAYRSAADASQASCGWHPASCSLDPNPIPL